MDSHWNPPESTREREESTDTEAGDIRRKTVELLHTVARRLVLCHGRQESLRGIIIQNPYSERHHFGC